MRGGVAQELIALDVKAALTVDGNARADSWVPALEAGLSRAFGQVFERCISKTMFGVQTWLFVRKTCARGRGGGAAPTAGTHARGGAAGAPRCGEAMADVYAEPVKVGFGGTVGNKGGIGLRLSMWGLPLCFVNAHLPSGSKHVSERNAAAGDVLASLGASVRFAQFRRPEDHALCVFFGDLNYRVVEANETVRELVAAGNLAAVRAHDQLTQELHGRRALVGFSEADMAFPPTYKYDTGTHDFDTSDKQRTPSWTDRVLFKGDGAECAAYASCMAPVLSDHKPVACFLRLRTQAARAALDKHTPLAMAPQPRAPPVDLLSLDDEEGAGGSPPPAQLPPAETPAEPAGDLADLLSLDVGLAPTATLAQPQTPQGGPSPGACGITASPGNPFASPLPPAAGAAQAAALPQWVGFGNDAFGAPSLPSLPSTQPSGGGGGAGAGAGWTTFGDTPFGAKVDEAPAPLPSLPPALPTGNPPAATPAQPQVAASLDDLTAQAFAKFSAPPQPPPR